MGDFIVEKRTSFYVIQMVIMIEINEYCMNKFFSFSFSPTAVQFQVAVLRRTRLNQATTEEPSSNAICCQFTKTTSTQTVLYAPSIAASMFSRID